MNLHMRGAALGLCLATVVGLPVSSALAQTPSGWSVTQQTQTRTFKRNTPEYLVLMAYLREHAERGRVRYGLTALSPQHLGDAFWVSYTGIASAMAAPADVSSPFPPPYIPTGPAGPGSTYVISSCNTATHEVQTWTWTYMPDSTTGVYSWELADYHSYYSPACDIHHTHPAPQ